MDRDTLINNIVKSVDNIMEELRKWNNIGDEDKHWLVNQLTNIRGSAQIIKLLDDMEKKND